MSKSPQDEKKSVADRTVALLDVDGTLYAGRNYNQILFNALKHSNISHAVAFTSFDAANAHAEVLMGISDDTDLTRLDLIQKFKQEQFTDESIDFITTYDPYLPEDSKSSWKEYYQPIYDAKTQGDAKNANNLYILASAHDLYYRVFELIRHYQLGAIDINYFNGRLTDLQTKCTQSVYDLTLIDEDFSDPDKATSLKWSGKLTDLSVLLAKKDFRDVAEVQAHFKNFFAAEFTAVTRWDKSPEYKAKQGDKGDMLSFALYKLEKQKIQQVILFDDKSMVCEMAKNVHGALSKMENSTLPSLSVYEVTGNLLKKPEEVGHKNIYTSEDFSAALNQKLQENLLKTEKPKDDVAEVEPRNSTESFCSGFAPGPRFFTGLKATATSAALATTTIGLVGSVLNNQQNENLFTLLPDDIKTSVIETLTASCQNVAGNYATYVAAALSFLMVAAVIAYNFDAIKAKLRSDEESYKPLDNNPKA